MGRVHDAELDVIRQTEREDVIKEVLELIDEECRDVENGKIIDRGMVYISARDLYRAVEALRGE